MTDPSSRSSWPADATPDEEDLFRLFGTLRDQFVHVARDFGDAVERSLDQAFHARLGAPQHGSVALSLLVEVANLLTAATGVTDSDISVGD